MNSIKFQKNWNKKLDCDYFHTIRRHTDVKAKYYMSKCSEEFDILVNGKTYCYAKLVQVDTTFELRDLPVALLFADTGADEPYDVFKEFGLMPSSKVIVLTFKVIKDE